MFNCQEELNRFEKAFLGATAIVCINAVVELFGFFKYTSFSYIDLIKIFLFCILIVGNAMLFTSCKLEKFEMGVYQTIILSIVYFCLIIIGIFDFMKYGFGFWLFFIEICYIFIFILIFGYAIIGKHELNYMK